MKFLDNKTPQIEFDNIHAFIAGMLTNKSELFQVDGYGAIASNHEAANIFYIVYFIPVPYTLQEDVK